MADTMNFGSTILHTLKVLATYLSSKQVNGCQGDGFSSVGARMGTITHNGWYLGLVAPVSSIVGLLSLYS